jgi:hypothetical protein
LPYYRRRKHFSAGGNMPFPPHRIKYLLREEAGYTVSDVSLHYPTYTVAQVSQCINGWRVLPELRIIISNLIHRHVDTVFGKHPETTALLEEREAVQQRGAA